MLNDKQFCVVVSSAVALVAFVCLMRFLPDLMAWTGWPMCGAGACTVQGWLGALSGWFGGLAAFATIWFIIGQLSEQRRQTDFALGDARPTMDVTPDLDDPRMLVVRIVNWNRRGALIRAIKVDFPTELGVMEVKRNGQDTKLLNWPMPIHGWEDRNTRGPETLQFKIAAAEGNKLLTSWPEKARVSVTAHILGDRHAILTLSAAIHP